MISTESVIRVVEPGTVPVIVAVQLRDLSLIRLLVNKGANPNKADTLAGMSAKDYAQRDGRSQAIMDILNGSKAAASSSAKSGPVQGPVF